MSADNNADKNIEKISKPDKAESRLDNPDAQEAREADKKTISEIGEQNPDNWMSKEGHFAIVDENQVLASRDVTEEKTSQAEVDFDKQNLSEELQAIKVSGNSDQSQLAEHIQEMRSTAKEKGLGTTEIDKFAKETFSSEGQEEQFKRGAFKSLSPDQESPEPTDQPIGGYEQENRADGGVTLKGVIPGDGTDERLAEIFKQVSELPLDKQIKVIGTGITAFQQELANQGNSIWEGTQRGVNKSVMGMVHDFENLANGVGQVWQFGQDVMTNNPRALETGAKAGENIGKAMVMGVKLWKVTESYLGNVGAEGDYGKPFRDLATLGEEIDKRWQALTPAEKAEVSSELLTNIAVPGAAGKLAKSTKFIERLEDLSDALKKLKPKDKDAFCKKFGELLDDLFGPRKDGLKPAYATAGDTLHTPEVKKGDTALFSQRHPSEKNSHHAKPQDNHSSRSKEHHLEKEKEDVKIKPRPDDPLMERPPKEHLPNLEFTNRLNHALENLGKAEREFLEANKIKVIPVKSIAGIKGQGLEKLGGAFVRSDKRIYIPETVVRQGKPELHDDIKFAIRHETGHAFNVMKEPVAQYPISEQSTFRELFRKDIANASMEKLDDLKLPFESREHLPFIRDEIFADLFAHATGEQSNNPFSQKVLELFPNCLEYVKSRRL